MAAADYHFEDRWRVRADVHEVADILSDAADACRWWPSTYLDIQVLHPGDARFIGQTGCVQAKGWLPYTVAFIYKVVENNYPHGFVIDSRGDLTGRGVWQMAQDGPWVDVRFTWDVRAGKPMLWRYSAVFRPLFRSNHVWTMCKGEQSLGLELARRRAGSEVERAAVPAPPGPIPSGPAGCFIGLADLLAQTLRAWLARAVRSSAAPHP
ncbi:MAG: SRPBCC family protein [Candidatus Promineifilaceae bacterium]